jgi:hypothetical protein
MASNATEQDKARPRFYMDAVHNMALSTKEGRPIYEDKEMVEVRIPGDKLFSFVSVVEEKHKERWPEHYAAFKRGEQQATIGMPLEHWAHPLLSRSRIAELKAMHIMSVEDLAGVGDNVLPKIGMNAREMRDSARAYIENAKGGAESSRLATEVADLRAQVAQLFAVKAPEPVPQKEKTLEDCTDAELKEYIKRETGEGVRGNPSRETLLKRAAEVAEKVAA